jgi:hypothetical protein
MAGFLQATCAITVNLTSSANFVQLFCPETLAQAWLDYLDAVLAYNESQFRMVRAIGKVPELSAPPAAPPPPAPPAGAS